MYKFISQKIFMVVAASALIFIGAGCPGASKNAAPADLAGTATPAAVATANIPAVGSAYVIDSVNTHVLGSGAEQFTLTGIGESFLLMNLNDISAGTYLVFVPKAGELVIVDPVKGEVRYGDSVETNDYWKPGTYIVGEYDRANN